MVNSGSLHYEVVRASSSDLIRRMFTFLSVFRSAHKVTEVKVGAEEVNVSYSDPENQTCKIRSKTFSHYTIVHHCFVDVSISGRADLVDDNIKKRDLWTDSLKAW